MPEGPSWGRDAHAPKCSCGLVVVDIVLCGNSVLTCGVFIGVMGSLEEGLPAVGCENSCPGMSQATPKSTTVKSRKSCGSPNFCSCAAGPSFSQL